MKKININLQNSSLSLVDKKHKAFTLAEILLSLTVIGIVAAIALPSLLGNANERAWETQKKALYTRFSQSLPLLSSLNGYGELYEKEKTGGGKELVDTAAETFIRDGLSKVMKITNICDSDHLADCGLPDKIIPINGGSAKELSTIKQISGFNPLFIRSTDPHADDFVMLDVKAAAFETVNGESILVYYNPNCQPDLNEDNLIYVQAKMCANFVYDLNGKKGPNTVGKDIGFITAMYSTDPVVVAPIPYPENLPNKAKVTDAFQKCKEAYGEDAKLPNLAELSSLFCNRNIVNLTDGIYASSIKEWVNSSTGINYKSSSNGERKIRCIKR